MVAERNAVYMVLALRGAEGPAAAWGQHVTSLLRECQEETWRVAAALKGLDGQVGIIA